MKKRKKNKEPISLLDNTLLYSDRFISLLKLLCDKYKQF